MGKGWDDVGAEDLHAHDVGVLLGDVHRAHVDVAGQAEVGRRRGHGHAVLARAGLGDDALLAHVLREHDLAHAMVDLVGAGVVEVLALEEDVAAELLAQVAAIVDGRGAALEVAADAPQLGDEVEGAADGVIGLRDLLHLLLEALRHVHAAVGAEVTVFVGIILEVGAHVHSCLLTLGSAGCARRGRRTPWPGRRRPGRPWRRGRIPPPAARRKAPRRCGCCGG